MRRLLVVLLTALPVAAADDRTTDKQLELTLRDVHDRGAALHNGGDPNGCYRMYQGGLLVARQMMLHRPELQKTITAGLQNAERLPLIANRAVALHELIEAVRTELGKAAKGAGPEKITVPPREIKADPKPAAHVGEVTDGIVGRVLWQGKPLKDVEVTFVTPGIPLPIIRQTVSGEQGIYSLPNLPPGMYTVVIKPTPACAVQTLPARYATTATTPLKVELKGQGEKFDLVLQ